VLHQATLCGKEEDCPDRVFRCRQCGYSAPTELDGCPACDAEWQAIDVSHGSGCPRNRLEEAMNGPNGAVVRRCFRILNAKSIGLTITLADITEEEFQVLELIEAERQEQIRAADGSAPGSR
jgi:predicted ATP-dependent serine protease